MFAVDYKAADGDVRPEGEYECIIKDAMQSVTKNGSHCIEVRLEVRKDVENPRGGIIFYNIWKAKKPNKADTDCEGYLSSWIHSLSKAAGMPNGKNYESIDEWCKDLSGRPVRAKVIHGEWNGRTTAEVNSVSETKFPLKPGSVPLSDNRELDFIPPAEDDDNLPF